MEETIFQMIKEYSLLAFALITILESAVLALWVIKKGKSKWNTKKKLYLKGGCKK